MRIAVINPRGNDPDQAFPDFAGAPDERAHAPVNYHAFAACTGGVFARDADTIPADVRAVVLLLTHDLSRGAKALIRLKRERKAVVIAWKEAGAHQIAAQLAKPSSIELFRELCERSDGAIATTPDLMPLFHGAGASRVEFIPTPYPVEDPRWDFARPEEEKQGVLIGTRELGTPTRNHLAALLLIRRLAEGMGEPVTVFNFDGWRGRRVLRSLGYSEGILRVVEERLPYPKWLRVVAKHRIVFQLDASTVPGQVGGDALLARVPCVGGHGTTERLVFPDLCGHGRTHEQLFDIAARLFEHPHDCAEIVVQAMEHARRTLSFERGAEALRSFFEPVLRG
jgi:hypothetical protein